MTDPGTTIEEAAWLTPAVRALPPHHAPQTHAELATAETPQRALHLNESPYPPSPRAIAAAEAALHDLNRYPDTRCGALAAAIAARTGVPAARIVFGVGSDELINVIAEMSLKPGDRCVAPAPSFPRYLVSTRLQGAVPVRVALDRDGAADGAALAAAVDARTPLVFACTPNPPSGGMMSGAALDAVVDGVPATTLLVIDEAYHEFGRHAGGPDVLARLARRRGPWIVLRTFSKAYCLAGLRIGYALCGSALEAEGLRRAKMQFNVTAVAQAAALAAYADEAYLRSTLDAVARERARLGDGLRALQLRVYPSAANFLSVDLGVPAQPVMQALAARGIHVRDWRDPGHLTQLRITIGLPADTDAVLDALPAALQGTPR
ncbi:MAG: aminotransferase class I/II-fold pyridoxal phosphate-dependent enzyme [Alphaproteobacteria bacterium]|nr:aminotransferase class I/II-fold pyridoxal phosphate-dependent enzyme [Alphaproteobacteria bacterium]